MLEIAIVIIVALVFLTNVGALLGWHFRRKSEKNLMSDIATSCADAISDEIRRQDDRIQKRLERQVPTNGDNQRLEQFKTGQILPGQPYRVNIER